MIAQHVKLHDGPVPEVRGKSETRCWGRAEPDSRLVELEDDESSDEDRKRQRADADNRVPPSHVVGASTARRLASFARWKRRVASVVRHETPRDERGDHDTDGLESR